MNRSDRRLVLAFVTLSVACPAQSLSVVAVTNPAVHGVAGLLGDPAGGRVFACGSAFYITAMGVGAGRTVSRWTESGGLEVVGVANPIPQPPGPVAPSFIAARQVGAWVYFLSGTGNVAPNSSTGGVWRCPADGTGPVTLYSTNWPSSLLNVYSGFSEHAGGLYFISNWRLARMDIATGAIADLGQVPGPGFFSVGADSSGVYCSTSDAIYRYDVATQGFSLLTLLGGAPWGLSPTRLVVEDGTVFSFSYAYAQGCHDTLLRVDSISGAFTQQTISCVSNPYNDPPSVSAGVVDYFSYVSPSGSALFVNSVDVSGAQATLLPSPCTLNVGEICEARAFFRGSGDAVHVISHVLQPYSNLWAIATFSPSPQPAGVSYVDPACAFPVNPSLSSTVPTLGGVVQLSLHGAPSVAGFVAHGSPTLSPIPIGTCYIMIDVLTIQLLPIATNAAGDWSASVVTPPAFALFAGIGRRWQAVLFSAGGIEVSNALDWTFGF